MDERGVTASLLERVERLAARRRNGDDASVAAAVEQPLGDAEHRVAAGDDGAARGRAREEPHAPVEDDAVSRRAGRAQRRDAVEHARDGRVRDLRGADERAVGQLAAEHGDRMKRRLGLTGAEEALDGAVELAREADRGIGGRNVAPALDRADERAADVRALGERVLGEVQREPPLANAVAGVGAIVAHARILAR